MRPPWSSSPRLPRNARFMPGRAHPCDLRRRLRRREHHVHEGANSLNGADRGRAGRARSGDRDLSPSRGRSSSASGCRSGVLLEHRPRSRPPLLKIASVDSGMMVAGSVIHLRLQCGLSVLDAMCHGFRPGGDQRLRRRPRRSAFPVRGEPLRHGRKNTRTCAHDAADAMAALSGARGRANAARVGFSL